MGNEKGIVVLGAGGHAGVIVDLIEAAARQIHAEVQVMLLDDCIPAGAIVGGRRVEGMISDCVRYPAGTGFIIGIGDNGLRRKIAAQYELNYITLVHPGAVIGGNVRLGKGTVVMAGAVVGCGTHIGEHCIINTGATVDHACILGDFVHISPGAHLGGEVRVGDGSWLGIGSCVRQGIEVGRDIIAGAGAAVVKNIKEKGIYTGIPAKKAQDETINTGK